MTEEQIRRACEIGTRFDASVPGAGLGLAIARDICTELDCHFDISSSAEGLTVRLDFAGPAAERL